MKLTIVFSSVFFSPRRERLCVLWRFGSSYHRLSQVGGHADQAGYQHQPQGLSGQQLHGLLRLWISSLCGLGATRSFCAWYWNDVRCWSGEKKTSRKRPRNCESAEHYSCAVLFCLLNRDYDWVCKNVHIKCLSCHTLYITVPVLLLQLPSSCGLLEHFKLLWLTQTF